MKLFLSGLTISLLTLSSNAFSVTTEECQAAWKSSSAYKSCYPAFGTKSIGDNCGIYVHCKKPDGSEVANGVTTHIMTKTVKILLVQIILYFILLMNLKNLTIAMVN